MKNFILYSTLFLILFSSCKKELSKQIINTDENPVASSFIEMQVPENFDWSNASYNGLTINAVDEFGASSSEFEGMPISLSTTEGDLIQEGVIYEGQFILTLNLPKTTQNVIIECPETHQSITVAVDESEVDFVFSTEKMSSFKALKDSDGDHVVDKYDRFPNDPERAFSGGFFSGQKVNGFKDSNNGGCNYYFHMFEDLWPYTGDYDFNDIIIALEFTVTTNWQNYIVGGHVKWYVWSVGSSRNYPTGLGHEFTKYIPEESRFVYMSPYSLTNYSSDFESIHRAPGVNASNNLILYENIFNHLDPYYNNCGDGVSDGQSWGKPGVPIKIEYDFSINSNQRLRGIALWPYLFLSDETGHQIRTYGMPPSATADMTLLNSGQDVSPNNWNWNPGNSFVYPLSGNNAFYKTEDLLPWGLEIIATNFKVPLEKISIIEAYPQFQDWAESGGQINQNWYNYPNPSKVFDVMPYFEP